MTFEWFMILFGWFAALAFVVVAGYRIFKIAQLPLNLRWEVYPVPHESEDKRAYGGSYMEELDWTTKPRSAPVIPEFIEMGTEIFALKRVREHNVYGLWPFSLAMHWGIYLYLSWLLLLVVENLISLPALSYLTTAVGLASFLLGLFGTLSLVVKRATNPDLHLYTTPVDYFNLLFLAAFFALSLAAWLNGLSFASHRAYIGSVLFFQPVATPTLTLAAFFVFELFMIYMPFTKLIHYLAKYFTFHHSLWDDEFNAKGSARDRKLLDQLAYPIRWSGPHIAPGKTWLEEVKLTMTGSDKK
jgi:nitrate reductase gamma subunit